MLLQCPGHIQDFYWWSMNICGYVIPVQIEKCSKVLTYWC